MPPMDKWKMREDLTRIHRQTLTRKTRITANVMGLCLGSFVIALYLYSLKAVGQEDYSNVDVDALLAKAREEKRDLQKDL